MRFQTILKRQYVCQLISFIQISQELIDFLPWRLRSWRLQYQLLFECWFRWLPSPYKVMFKALLHVMLHYQNTYCNMSVRQFVMACLQAQEGNNVHMENNACSRVNFFCSYLSSVTSVNWEWLVCFYGPFQFSAWLICLSFWNTASWQAQNNNISVFVFKSLGKNLVLQTSLVVG